MKCKFCGKDADRGAKIKKGWLCDSCWSMFPKSIQDSIASFNVNQLKEIKKNIFEAHSEPLYECGSFAAAERSVQLNGYEYPFNNTTRVTLNFHPTGFSEDSRGARGWLTIAVFLKKPAMRIEEPVFLDQTEILYTIQGRSITYLFRQDLAEIVSEINRAIETGVFSLRPYFREKEKEWERQRSQKNQSQKERSSRQFYSKKQEKTQSPLERAQMLFEVEPPYTQDDIRRIRRKKLQSESIHPDNGGSSQKFEEFNSAYRLLLKFAVDAKA